jgi:hypothetical protein
MDTLGMIDNGYKYQIACTTNAACYDLEWTEFMKHLAHKGIAINGIETNFRLREQLQGQPNLSGFCGPMWGGRDGSGTPRIRYESTEFYRDMAIS